MNLPMKLPPVSAANVAWNQVVDALRSLRPASAPGVLTSHGQLGVGRFSTRSVRPGLIGWHFGSKIEVDNSQTYPAQTVIHIQDTHSLVTAGIRDAANPTGGLVKSKPGFWVSTRAVPAKTQVSGNDVWNLPQWPMPDETNMDAATNYWIYLGEVVC